MRVMNVAYTVH